MIAELTKSQLEDLKFLKDQNWPHWPVCCLKRPKKSVGMPEAGSVFYMTIERNKPTVYLTSIWAITKHMTQEAQFGHLDAVGNIEYDSIEAMLADGWQVD